MGERSHDRWGIAPPGDFSLKWVWSDDGAFTNRAELLVSCLRRAEVGQHHHIAGPYLTAYSREIAWREDHRRVSNGEQHLMIASAALAHPVSRQWKGYWQRNWH